MASLGLRSLAGALLITLGGCDSIAYRTIEIQRADSSSRTAVSQVVGEFAQKEGFPVMTRPLASANAGPWDRDSCPLHLRVMQRWLSWRSRIQEPRRQNL